LTGDWISIDMFFILNADNTELPFVIMYQMLGNILVKALDNNSVMCRGSYMSV